MFENRTQVMVDLEGLSTSFDAAIVSIAAVKFTLSKGIIDEFVINIDPADCKKHGLRFSKDSIDWWAGQSKEARDAWRVNPVPLFDGLTKFSEWYGEKSHPTWAKGGGGYDFPVLTTAYRACGLREPFKYWDCMDYRTIIKVLGIDDRKMKTEGSVYHSAIDDCREQTKVLLPILIAIEENQ